MKIANYIFIIVYLAFILLVAGFNYIIDPWGLFNKSALNISPDFMDSPYTPIKLSKNKKAQKVIIGGSEAKYLNIQKYDDKIADISTYYATIDDVVKLSEFYLKLHPETKKVYFLVEFKLFDKRERKLEAPKPCLCAKEIYKIFLSIDTTKKSINKLLKKDDNKLKIDDGKNNIEALKINPLIITKDNSDYSKNAIKNLDKLFNLLKKKNIEIICLIPPSHANYQLRMYERLGDKKDEIIKYLAKNSTLLINMEMINNESTTKIKDSKKYFLDEIHISDKYAKILYEALIAPDKKNDLYDILNEKNIDSYLLKHKKDILNYKKSNYSDYLEYRKRENEKLTKSKN